MYFTKWQACGNNFIFINGFDDQFTENDFEKIVEKTPVLCDSHFGIGADGIIFILPSDKADLKMRIFNNDGSEAEMCGNGIRCFAKWAYQLGIIKTKKMTVETGAGILSPELLDDGNVRVDMGCPRLLPKQIPVTDMGDDPVINQKLLVQELNRTFDITCVSMGNPHCVIFGEDPEAQAPEHYGPYIETDPHFPQKTNVEFVKQLDKNLLRMRVWERGVGVTLACGTGTCATVVAAILNGKIKDAADVKLDGGTLHIEWAGKESDHVFMTGPAEMVFEGNFNL